MLFEFLKIHNKFIIKILLGTVYCLLKKILKKSKNTEFSLKKNRKSILPKRIEVDS